MGIKATVMDFLTKPAAPSGWHRIGVAVAAFGVAGYAARRRDISPVTAAAAGAVTLAVGHALAPSWAAKTVGMGLLASAAASEAYDRIAPAPPPPSAPQPPAIPTNGVQTPPAVAPQSSTVPDVMSEAQFLLAIEDRTIPIEVLNVPSGRARPSGSAGTFVMLPKFVQLPDGRLVSPVLYVSVFPQKVAEADAKGRARRSMRAAPELPAQTEEEYLRWVQDFCLITSHPNGARLASNPAAVSEQAMRIARDIVLPNGEFRSNAAYAAEFSNRIAAAYAECSERLRSASDNGLLADAPPSTSADEPVPYVEITDLRVPVTRDQMASNTTLGGLVGQPVSSAPKNPLNPGALIQPSSFKTQQHTPTGPRATMVGGERYTVTDSNATPVNRVANPSGAVRGGNGRTRKR